MAKDFNANVSKDTSKETLSKEELKAKKENEKKSRLATASKKPKKSIIKFFKDAKSEFKKVVWPTPKQVAKNTTVVLVTITALTLAIWGVDSVFAVVLRFAFKMN